MVGFFPLTPMSAPDCCLPPFLLCVHLRSFLPFVRFFLASVLLASVCVRFGFGRLDGAHTKNQHCIQPPPLSVEFYDFLPLTPVSAPACCLRQFCLPLFTSVLALGALMGPTQKGNIASNHPPYPLNFMTFYL